MRKQAFREFEEMSRATLALRAGVWRWRVQERLLVSGVGKLQAEPGGSGCSDPVSFDLTAPQTGRQEFEIQG